MGDADMATNLPLHPTKRHPLTGEPLQAIWVDPAGRVRWPIIGAAEDDPGPGGDDPQPDPVEPKFPANTPVAEMKPEEKADYWQDKARKHEGRVKAFGGLTPEELTSLREKAKRLEDLEAQSATDTERAAREAKAAAQTEADALYKPLLAETAFRVAIGDRKPQNEVDDFIADLNLSRFLNDAGRVDTAKVLARVEQFAPAKGNQQQQRGPVMPRGAVGGQSGSTSLTSLGGSELYDRLHPKKPA